MRDILIPNVKYLILEKMTRFHHFKLYPGGFAEYTYARSQNSQEFALDGGVIFDILANSNESRADGVIIAL